MLNLENIIYDNLMKMELLITSVTALRFPISVESEVFELCILTFFAKLLGLFCDQGAIL